MPVRNDIYRVFPVDEKTVIARYLDYSKFLSLLFSKSLFFCRLDKFDDRYEGKLTSLNPEGQKNFWIAYNLFRKSNSLSELSKEEIDQKIKEDIKHDQKMRALICVNCWNRYLKESPALWKIYSDSGKGILIKSTVARLTESLKKAKQEMAISYVRYIDHFKEEPARGNKIFLTTHKVLAYDYEEEIRVIHFVSSDKHWRHSWNREKNKTGIHIKVDPKILIDEIIVGPTAPDWTVDLIKDISCKYGLDVSVTKSHL
jgi:hypothetical protein